MKRLSRLLFPLLTVAALGAARPASALPGFYAGKKEAKRHSYATHVVLMTKGNYSVVTVAPDYDGPLDAFALVMPVPADVTTEHVQTLKREFVDRVENITAPRFHEFWEMDPCEPGPPEQIWEQSMKAKAGTAFLGGGPVIGDPTKKVAKELFIDIKPSFKEAEAEYGYTVLTPEQSGNVAGWLEGKGYIAPAGANEAVKPYLDKGMTLLVAEVDPKRVELVGGDRAQLSPIRYWSEKPITTIPAKLGLLNLDDKQELFVYVLAPDKRYEAKNYDNVFPPTNLSVDFVAKERMGELYAAIHDKLLAKNPKGVLDEFAWTTKGCGRPCATEPLMPHELMSLGGDVLEQGVADEEKNPEPPELTEKEQKEYDAKVKELKGKEKTEYKKTFEEERKEVARRKALIARNVYVLSRLHHRYDASNLPTDIEVGPAEPVGGGTGIPKGEAHELSTEVKPAKRNELQVRFNFFHPWNGMVKCEKPEHWRWGKPPRTYRGLRKTWVATDLTRKNRKQIDPDKVVFTPVPSIGIAGATPDGGTAADGGDAGTEGAGDKKKSCGCSVPGAPEAPGPSVVLLLAAGAVALSRRRRR